MSRDDLAVQRAVAAARAQPHGFVFAPPGASPAVLEALRALAVETGREFLEGAVTSAQDKFVQEYLNRDVPQLKAGDDRAFLDNLKDIAAGKVRVKT